MSVAQLGFLNVPISPTFEGVAGKMRKGIVEPARKAGREASQGVAKSAEDMVKSLERQVEASSKKVADLERAHADSTAKREVQQKKLNAAIAEQAAAEENYQKALASGDSGLAQFAKVEKARAKVTDETLKLTKAERDVADAGKKLSDQQEDLAKTSERYEKAQKGANAEAKSGTGIFDKLREKLGLTAKEMDETGRKAGGLGDNIKTGLKGVGTGALLGIGAQIGSSVMSGIKGGLDAGFDRLASIEQAESMLGGLGHTTEATAEIMDNAMASVKGTAFGFGEAAQMAATFVGAGIPEGEELTKVLTLVGDTAAITGSDLNEMGSIWTKIATGQRLGTEEMNQLADRGLGLLPKLQEHYSVTADEARKMVTEGKVSFDDFSEIMEDMVGGSAQAMGDTFAGSAANMRAALGRLGAQFLEPIFNTAPAMFQAIGGAVDALGEELDPVIARISGFLEPLLQRFADVLGPALEGAVRGVSAAFGLLGDGLGTLWSWLSTVFAPGWEWVTGHISTAIETVQVAWQEITSAFQGGDWGYGALASMIGADNAQWVVDKISLIKPAWEELTSAFQGGDWGYGALAELVGADNAEWIVNKISSIIPAFDELWAAINGIDWGSGGLQDLVGAEAATWILDTIDRLRENFVSFKDSVVDTGQQIVDALAPVVEWMGQFFNDQLSATLESLGGALGSVAGAFGSVASAVGGTLWSALQGVVDLFIGLWEFLSPVLMPILKAVAGVVGGALVGAFAGLVGGIRVAAEVIELLANGARWLIDHSVVPLVDAIGGLIDWFREGSAAADVVKGVLVGLGSAIGVALLPILGMLVGQWVLTGVQAVASAGRQVAAWAMTGGAAVKNGLLSVGALARTAAGWVAAGVQSTLGAAKMAAAWVVGLGPIGWAIGAIVGIGAALVAFFTKTETGRELWSKFTEFLGNAWDWVVEKFQAGVQWVQDAWSALTGALQSGYENYIKPVFDALVEAGKWLVTILATIVITPIMLAWEALSAGIQWWWENVTRPALDAMGRFFSETLWPIVQSVIDWVSEKWSWLSDMLAAGWSWIQSNVLDPFVAGLQFLWDKALEVIDWIVGKWQWLGDMLATAWSWIDENVIQRFIRGMQRIWDKVLEVADWVVDKWNWLGDMLAAVWSWIDENFVQRQIRGWTRIWNKVLEVADWIKDKWSWLGEQLQAGYAWVQVNVFDKIGSALETVRGWFQTGVDAIKEIWDGLKQKLAEPINFIIQWVYNDGIKKVFDGVADKVNLDARLPKIDLIGGFYRGGILPGWSRMQDGDDQLVPMRRGEGVLVSEGLRDRRSREAFLAANEAAKSGLPFADFVERARGFAGGGILNYAGGGMSATQASHARFVGKYFTDMFALTSTNRNEPGSYHDFGVQGATDWQAQDGQVSTQMPTPWSKQLAQAIAINFPNSRELIHYPLDGWQNILDGSPHVYNAGTNAGHGNHVHWATGGPIRWEDGELVLDDVPGAGAWFNPANWFSGLWDRITGALPKFDGSGFGDLAEWPGATLKTLGGWVKDWALDKLASLRNLFTGGDGGGGSQQWSTAASEALRRAGYDDSLLDITLQQVDIESSGIPNNQNNWDSNAMEGDPTVGLLQVKGTTFQMMRNMYPEAFADLPNDRTDPVANMTAGILWSKYAYGGPQNVWPTRDGYAHGGIVGMPELFTRDLGGLVPHGALVRNTSGRDELMLPPETTRLMNRFFAEFPEVAVALTEAMIAVESAAVSMEKAMDFTSMEGMTARQTTRAVLGLGIELPGADLVTAVLDAEQTLWDGRARHIGHLTDIEDKQKALEEAQQRLIDLQGDSVGLSTQQQRKLDDAQKALEEAQAAEASAGEGVKDDTKRKEAQAKAADKVTDAEEKLRRVREDIAEDGAKSEEKRAEEVEKAHSDIMKAEEDLYEARKAQIMDLDHIVVLSQENVDGWGAQANQLGGQLVQMGVSAAAVSQGLGAVSGALGAVSAAAGPAGITLGMAFQALQIVIQLVQIIDGLIKEWLAGIARAKTAQLEAMNDYLSNISQVTSVIHDQRSAVVELASTVVSAFIRMGDAARGMSAAAAGVFQAGLDGAKNVADIQKQILDLRGQLSGGGESSAPVPWDMGLMYDSYSNQLTASPKVKASSQGTSLRDVVSEIAALNWDLQAALIDQQIMIKQAQIDQIRAEFEVLRSRLNLDRAFADLIQGVQRLEMLERIQVDLAITEQQARIQQDINQLLIQNAQAEQVQNDLMNKIGSALDFDGDGKVFGIFDNLGSKAVQASESSIRANEKQIEVLGGLMEQYGGSPNVSAEAIKAAEDVAYFMKEGREDLASLALNGSPLGDAVRATQVASLMQDLWAIDDRNESSRRALEDLALDFEEYLATEPLQQEIDQLTHEREAYTAQAEILRASSEDVKLAAAALRDFHREAAAREPQVVTVNVPASGQVIDADDLAATISGLGADISGLDFRVQRVESMNAPKGNAVLSRKR